MVPTDLAHAAMRRPPDEKSGRRIVGMSPPIMLLALSARDSGQGLNELLRPAELRPITRAIVSFM